MKMPAPIAAKLDRLASGAAARPRVLDLFAGCGGLSLGFQAAGCEIVAATELDELAALSHATNFFKGCSQHEIDRHAKSHDITEIDPEELIAYFGLGPPSRAIDIIVGGPPCQAYARVGRAKLREVAEHPQAFKVDPRANLYLRYLRYVERLKPLALMMENVPDILNHGGHNVIQEIVEALETMGYDARYSLINSAHHGIPQMRDRVFMIAFHRSLGAPIRFPGASHCCELFQSYLGHAGSPRRSGTCTFQFDEEPCKGASELTGNARARASPGCFPSGHLGSLRKIAQPILNQISRLVEPRGVEPLTS